MQNLLWLLASLTAYIAGLIVIMFMTPMLPIHAFDEVAFMGAAIVAIVGAILAFGGIVAPFYLFNGNLGIRGLDFVMLLGILIVAGRTALRSFRPPTMEKTFAVSRILAGAYCLFLAAAAAAYIVLLFAIKQP